MTAPTPSLVLLGQPNSGKSTLFNAVAGYKTAVANFPGTTIEFARSAVVYQENSFDIMELPGIYSLSSASEEERRTRDQLLNLQAPVLINVVDASLLSRSLELTLELLEMRVPLVVCLNMMDEAERKGIRIDVAHLQEDLGVPVIPVVATTGQGLTALFDAALQAARQAQVSARTFYMSRDVEAAVGRLEALLPESLPARLGLSSRLLAIKLLEQDDDVRRRVAALEPALLEAVNAEGVALELSHGRPADVVVSSERHALCMNLFEHVATVRTRARRGLRDRLDAYVMHPVWGYAILAGVLVGFFYVVFSLGKVLETPLLSLFSLLNVWLEGHLPAGTLVSALVRGLVQGLSGGVGIVLPYLVPFLGVMAVLEDVGYIPRAAFLMDALMHRMGLHGKAIIPFVLGYGCTVPALMGTRVMESARDRYVTAILLNFIPCAARTTVIFALVGFFIGPWGALGFYLLSLVVIAASGWLFLRIRPEASVGLILEIPGYRLPTLRAVAQKVWFRMEEFVVMAWPIIIGGSLGLTLLEHFRLSPWLNDFLAPFTTGVLDLPAAAGITFIFGILRKELTIVMLVQALGTSDFGSVLTPAQLATYTAFSLFYVPCLATLAALRSVTGWKGMFFTLFFTTLVATLMALLMRLGFALLG